MILLFEILPEWYQGSLLFILGLIIGSFLNVVIYRFHTGKSLSGHSHCLSCTHMLTWYELVPLASYILLRGKCKSCSCKIPARYFLVELTTGILFFVVWSQISDGWLLLFSLFLISILMIISVYDIYHMVIPNELVIMISILAGVYYFLEYGLAFDFSVVLSHTLAAAGAFLFYGGLWFFSKGRWIGFGDAKLAIPLGFIVGVPGVFSSVVLSFWVGAVLSISVMSIPAIIHILRRYYSSEPVLNYAKYFTMKSEVPFAPFMILAFLLVYVYHIDVIALLSLFV